MDELANIAGGNVIVRSLAKVRFTTSGSCANYEPWSAVLNGPNCWCPKESQKNKNQWLQLDLGEVKTVHGFETQGHASYGGHWCRTLRFDTSIDGRTWNNQGVFRANKGTDDIKNNKLKNETFARYVRFYPQKCGGGHGGWGKLRVEVYWTEALNFVPEQKDGEQKTDRDHTENDTENDKDHKGNGLPEFPGTVVNMHTELIRLRGGPYWSESYALLRATTRSASVAGESNPTLCVVDHHTDGGRWILLSTYQSECRNHNTMGNSLPKRTVGELLGCSMTNVNQFGALCGIDFESLRKKHKQQTVVSAVRVFGCSLQSQRIVHYKTSHPTMLKKVQTNVRSICKQACKGTHAPLPPGGNYEPLVGHHRFGGGGNPFDPCQALARWSGCCASTEGLAWNTKDVAVGLVWVRLRDGFLVSTDPNDPSFLVGNNGNTLTDNPVSGAGATSVFMHNSLTTKNKTPVEPRTRTGSLEIVKQQSYDETAIEMMVRPKDLVQELQTHELKQIEREYNIETRDIPCFHCEGTGQRWVAVKNVYGEKAGQEAKCNYESRQHRLAGGMNLSNIEGNQVLPLAAIASATLAPAPKAATAPLVRDNASFFQDHGVVLPLAKEAEARGETIAAKYVVVPVGSKTSNETLNSNMLRVASTSTDEDSDRPHPGLDRCWVCRGTGQAAGTVLQNVMDRAMFPTKGESKDTAETKSGETKDDIENANSLQAWNEEETFEEDDDEVCAICWAEVPKFGISTSCTHFFCVDCIQGHLKQIQNSGEFPGYCPMCQASAPNGEESVYGRIDGKAMTFLQRHGVIEKHFQFSFMRNQNEKEELFFECPAKCGNYLIDVDPTYVMRNHAPTVKTERCPCGKGVCVQCHQLVPEEEFYTHRCPETKIDHSMDDAATMAMMKKLGKKCPNCAMFIIKNEGCDIMMCGDKAHGDLRKAIKAGGCGQTFKWSNLKMIEDNITNFQGKRVRCNPPKKYAKEIAREKKRLGITMTDSESKMVELDLEKLEIENPGGGAAVGQLDPAIAPINLARRLLHGSGRNIMDAVRRRDSYYILSQIVSAYAQNPKKRIDGEARLWRDNPNGPPFGKPGEVGNVWCCACFAWYPVLKNLLKIALWPLCNCFNRKSKCGCGHRSIFLLYTLIFPLYVFACGYVSMWSASDGPLTWFSMIWFFQGMIFHQIAAYMDNSYVYNSPLTYACVHGSPDIVRLLLQHGADPNKTADSLMTPVVAAFVHGNWACVDVLESTYDQHQGHNVTPQDNGRNWLTKFRLRGTSAFNCNNDPNARNVCWCTPRLCATYFCRCCCFGRPRATSEVARRRRARQEHGHNHVFNDGARRGCECHCLPLALLIVNFIILNLLVFISIDIGFLWRYQVQNFDWDLPGQYTCIRNLSRTGRYGINSSISNSTQANASEWIDIQYTRIGANGFFSSFSDPALVQFNVDFDFRHVGRAPGRFYTDPIPQAVKMEITRPRAKHCPVAESSIKPSIVEQHVQGVIKCTENCMPCDTNMEMGTSACDPHREMYRDQTISTIDHSRVYTISNGKVKITHGTIKKQPDPSYTAFCRCVSSDLKLGLSICSTGACIDSSSKVCDASFGCSVPECSETCTCKPKKSGNKMTYAQCQTECGVANMVIPFSEEGRKKAQGTGCGIDSLEMWVSMSTSSLVVVPFEIADGMECKTGSYLVWSGTASSLDDCFKQVTAEAKCGTIFEHHASNRRCSCQGAAAERCPLKNDASVKMYETKAILYTIESGTSCIAIGKEQITTPQECEIAANALSLKIGTMKDWSRTNVPGGCLLEIDDQDVDFNANLRSKKDHRDRRLICKNAQPKSLQQSKSLQQFETSDFYSVESIAEDQSKCTSYPDGGENNCCACDPSIGMNQCDFIEPATCTDNYTPVNKESTRGKCQYTCVKIEADQYKQCNAPVQDTACDSPYFLMGSYQQDPLKALGEQCEGNEDCASGYCYCPQFSSASSLLAPTAFMLSKSTFALATASMLHLATRVYAQEHCFCAVDGPPQVSSPSLLRCIKKAGGEWTRPYGNVATTKAGVESCRDMCKTGGYKYWGTECPMTTQVHCQCSNASSLDATGSSLAITECTTNAHTPKKHCVGPFTAGPYGLGAADVGTVYTTRDTAVASTATNVHTQAGHEDPTKCSSSGNDCCACDKSIGMNICSGGEEPATCKDHYVPVNKETTRGQCQYTCVKPSTTSKIKLRTDDRTWDENDEEPTKCTSKADDCCACDRSIGQNMCSFSEPATCRDNYTPINKERSQGMCRYTCVKTSKIKASQNQRLAGGSAFSLSVNKLRFEISGGTCNNNAITGAGRKKFQKKGIEFGVDAEDGADRYRPEYGVAAMMCLGHYFSQPSMMLKVSEAVIDFFHISQTQTTIAEIRSDTYNAFTGINEGPLRGQRSAANGHGSGNGHQNGANINETRVADADAVSTFIVMDQPTDKTGFQCDAVPGRATTATTIATEQECRRAAEWYVNQPGDDPRGYKKTFVKTMSGGDRPPGCHIAGNGISFNSNLQSTDTDGHDALVCRMGPASLPSMRVGRKVLTFNHDNHHGGCGWISFANVSVQLNGTVNVRPSFLYTDANGWILTNQMLKNLNVDPGPNVVFASSYYGGHEKGLFDYCDGYRLSSRLGDDEKSLEEEKVLISYKSEPLKGNTTRYDGAGHSVVV